MRSLISHCPRAVPGSAHVKDARVCQLMCTSARTAMQQRAQSAGEFRSTTLRETCRAECTPRWVQHCHPVIDAFLLWP